MRYIELAFVVVCVVAVVQALGKRLPLPTPLLLVGCGAVLSRFAHLDSLNDQAPLVFVILVPPLLYIEAWLCPKRELWDTIKPVIGLAVGLVGATILVIAYGSRALLPVLSSSAAVALAAALAPTDTVAVASLSKGALLASRLKVLLSGEGLFNDVVALVAFEFAVYEMTAGQTGLHSMASVVVKAVGGGLFVGIGVAAIAFLLRRSLLRMMASDDHEHAAVDVLLSLMTPYAAYLCASKLDVSGVLAVIVTGLICGVLDKRLLTPPLRLQGKSVWTTAQIALNGAVFVLLGLEARQVLARLPAMSAGQLLFDSLLITTVLVVIRAIWLGVAVVVFQMQTHTGPSPRRRRDTVRDVLLASLCGVRGTLTLTAALSVPVTTASGIAFAGRDLIVALAAGTVLTTLVMHAVVYLVTANQRSVAHPDLSRPARDWIEQVAIEHRRDELERLARSSTISEEIRMKIEEELDITEMAAISNAR